MILFVFTTLNYKSIQIIWIKWKWKLSDSALF